ncbi:MAG: phosphomannomutase/phosphoglucomutase [Actinobacteria bacterium]|nr:phosphomannomutase/phosphoglucomutase [Actinomycetota bacterium]
MSTDPAVLDRIVKAYDIRGTTPDEMNDDVAYALGVAFADFVKAPTVLVGRDMRVTGESLAESFSRGVISRGVNVVNLGLASTDLVYFAAGSLDAPGAMFTASHNPAEYNGIKFCLSGARPVGIDTGLATIRDAAKEVLAGRGPADVAAFGTIAERDMLNDFADHVVSFIDVDSLIPMKVVADTANGMGGLIVPVVFDRLPMMQLEVMYPELDGSFPNHPADPIQPANQRDLQARVVSGGFDIGLAFDGDADRVFVVDEQGRGVSGSTTTAILAAAVLRAHPGATVLHNLICSRSVPEVITENGGVPVRTKVGHSNIKQVMAETGAVFGGEHSAHYYFLDNYRADSGIIATMFMLQELSRAQQPLSELRKPFERYEASGEINTSVSDAQVVMAEVAKVYSKFPQDWIDGLTVDCGDWWFNLRPSNTEPLLRLNLEASTRDDCDTYVAEVLSLVTSV